jgi:hypothetical protein
MTYSVSFQDIWRGLVVGGGGGGGVHAKGKQPSYQSKIDIKEMVLRKSKSKT